MNSLENTFLVIYEIDKAKKPECDKNSNVPIKKIFVC